MRQVGVSGRLMENELMRLGHARGRACERRGRLLLAVELMVLLDGVAGERELAADH